MTADEAIYKINQVLSSDYHYDETLGYQLTSDDFDWIELAIEALKEKKEREANEPLTIEQLFDFDETPVFVKTTWDGSSINRWAMVKVYPNFVTLRFSDGGLLYVEKIRRDKIYKYPPVE